MARVPLEGVDEPAVLTRLTVSGGARPRGRARSCLAERWGHGRARPPFVERVTAHGVSVTMRDVSGRALLACDSSPGARKAGATWCGAAYGLARSGRLRDPRLDLLCTTRSGARIAFLWIQPDPSTRYLAVEQDGYVEVYETASGLPVRIATTAGVDVHRSSASVRLSEHDATGELVRRYELRAAVAG